MFLVTRGSPRFPEARILKPIIHGLRLSVPESRMGARLALIRQSRLGLYVKFSFRPPGGLSPQSQYGAIS